MIESEHTCSRSTPDFMVKLTPSVCGWIATTGFMGVHCPIAGDTSSNTKRTTRKTRGNEFLSRIIKDLGEMRFVERELASNWTRRQRWKDIAALAARAEGLASNERNRFR